MDDKIKIIEKIYYDPAGYGSVNATLKDAKKYDKSITYEDVKNGKPHKHLDRRQNLEV